MTVTVLRFWCGVLWSKNEILVVFTSFCTYQATKLQNPECNSAGCQFHVSLLECCANQTVTLPVILTVSQPHFYDNISHH